MGGTARNGRPSANPFPFISPTFFPKEKLRKREKAGERACVGGGEREASLSVLTAYNSLKNTKSI